VRTTQRDATVLRWLVEQYCAPHQVVGELLARHSPSEAIIDTAAAASRWASRMEALDLARRQAHGGRVWLVPTVRGMRTAGCAFERWSLDASAWSLEHVEAVGRLRLYLEAHRPEGRWESERAIRARWAGTGARVRRADGGLWWPDGTATGVELELHVKRLDRYQAAVADQDPSWSDGCWWFCPAAQVRLLAARLAEAGATRFDVLEAPEGVAP
jgi:hypothetical protein